MNPTPKGSRWRVRKWLLAVLAVVAVALVWVGLASWSRKAVDDASEQVDATVTAEQLLAEYQANEKDADKRYMHKWLEVRGAFGKSELAHNYVTLESRDRLQKSSVECWLKPHEPGRNDWLLPLLRPNHVLRVYGVCKGKCPGGVWLTRCDIRPAVTDAERFPVGKYSCSYTQGVRAIMHLRADGSFYRVRPGNDSNAITQGRVEYRNGTIIFRGGKEYVEVWHLDGEKIRLEHWYPAAHYPSSSPIETGDVTRLEK